MLDNAVIATKIGRGNSPRVRRYNTIQTGTMALYIVVTNLPFKRHLTRSVKAYSGLALIEADCSVKS